MLPLDTLHDMYLMLLYDKRYKQSYGPRRSVYLSIIALYMNNIIYTSVIKVEHFKCLPKHINQRYYANISIDDEKVCHGQMLSSEPFIIKQVFPIMTAYSMLLQVSAGQCSIPCTEIHTSVSTYDMCDICKFKFISLNLNTMFCSKSSITLISDNHTCSYLTISSGVSFVGTVYTARINIQSVNIFQIPEGNWCIVSINRRKKCTFLALLKTSVSNENVKQNFTNKSNTYEYHSPIGNVIQSEKLSWIEAETICQKDGGHLLHTWSEKVI
jgi:hypothetical protein